MENLIYFGKKNFYKKLVFVIVQLMLVFSVFGQSGEDLVIPREFKTHPEYGMFKSEFKGYELIHLRDQFSKLYLNPDGSFSKTQGKDPLHYKEEQGRWLTFSNKITRNSNNNLLEIKGTDKPVSVNTQNGQNTLYLTKEKYIQWGDNTKVMYFSENGTVGELRPNQNSDYNLDGNKLSIPDFFTGIERVQYLDYFQLRTDFILDEKPNIPNGSKYMVIEDVLHLPVGYTVGYFEGEQTKEGWYADLEIYDEKGEPVGGFSKPVIFDNYVGQNKDDVSSHIVNGLYQVDETNDGYSIKILVSVDWLMSPDRIYPVTIDPTASNTPPSVAVNLFGGTGSGSACSTTTIVNLPANSIVTDNSFNYIITGGGTSPGYKSEQRSRMQGPSATEGSWTSGVGASSGDMSYSRSNAAILTGEVSGNQTFTLWHYQTWCTTSACASSSSCEHTLKANSWEVTVTYAAPCAGTPTGGTSSPASINVTVGNTTGLTLSGYTSASGITFQWQQSEDGSTGWSNVAGGSGATTASYTTPAVTEKMYYRCLVTCSNSGISSTSSSSLVSPTLNMATGTNSYTVCGLKFYDSGGAGGNYGNSQNRVATFLPASAGSVVQADVNSFDVENHASCGYDYLEVFDGNSTAAPLIGKYCGTTIPSSFTSTAVDGSLTFKFLSDGSITRPGWDIDISCVTLDYVVEWVSMDIGNSFWCKELEAEREISVTLKNIGDKTWNSDYTTNIGVRWSTDGSTASPWSDYHVRVSSGSLAPGATGTFTMNLRPKNATGGPSYTTDLGNGLYYLVFDVVNEGQCWFASNGGVCGPGNSTYVSSAITLTDDCIEFCADGTYELTSPHITDNILWYDDQDPCARPIGEGNPFEAALTESTVFYTDGFNDDELSGDIEGNALTGNNSSVNFAEVGQMFDIEAPSDRDLIVTGITIVKRAADQHIDVYYRPESYINYWEGQDQAGWTKVVDEYSASGATSTFELNPAVIIPAGCKYGFYTHADVNYTTDLTTRSNAHITLYSGHGGVFSTSPFVMQAQRSFSGTIYYESRLKTDRVPVVASKIPPPTAPDAVAGLTPICPDEEVTLTASGGTTSGDNVEVWFDKACNDAFVEDWATLGYTPVSTTVNSVQRGILNVTSTTIDPVIPMYSLGSWNPNTYKYIQIRYRVTSGTAGNTEMFFTNGAHAAAHGSQMVSAPMVSDGEWHILNIDMSTHASWTHSNITGWRYDYATSSGATIDLDFIALSANEIIGVGDELTVSPSETTTYYVQRRGLCGETACFSKEIVVNQPTIITTLTAGDAVWNGADDTDYNTINNWYIYDGALYEKADALPTSSTNVVIPAPGTCIDHNPNIAAATRSVQDITIETGATLTIGSGILNVSRNFTNNGTLTPGTGTVNFNGSVLQELGGSTSTTFYNLTLNNDGGGASQLELNQDISVTNNLTMTDGALDLNNLTIDLGATGTLVGESNSTYVFCNCADGYIRSSGLVNTADVIHNLGGLGLEITPSTGKGLGDVEVKRKHYKVAAADGLEKSIARVYEVTKNGGGSVDNNGTLDADIAFSYLTHELNGILAEDLSIYRQPTIGVQTWMEHGGAVNVGTQKLSYESWNEFSGLTGGEFVSALPVTYLGMQAYCDEELGNVLLWQTASEQNAHYFDVERSIDGYEWNTVGRVQAAGNTSSQTDYEYIDEGTNAYFEGYYRLRQVDFDGVYEYFPAVSLFCKSEHTFDAELYPNPTTGIVNLLVYFGYKLDADAMLVLSDATGRIVYQRNVVLQDGTNNFVIDMGNYQQGMYTLAIRVSDEEVLYRKVVKH